jgi:hypothetical protein
MFLFRAAEQNVLFPCSVQCVVFNKQRRLFDDACPFFKLSRPPTAACLHVSDKLLSEADTAFTPSAIVCKILDSIDNIVGMGGEQQPIHYYH